MGNDTIRKVLQAQELAPLLESVVEDIPEAMVLTLLNSQGDIRHLTLGNRVTCLGLAMHSVTVLQIPEKSWRREDASDG